MKMGHAVSAFGCLLFILVATGAVFSGCGRKQEEQKMPRITINSAPEQGASVLMTGIARGETPVTIEDLPPGTYDVILRLDRYRRTIEEISITEEGEQEFTVEMEAITGTFSVKTTPPGAVVYLDGEEIGVTPLAKRVLQVG